MKRRPLLFGAVFLTIVFTLNLIATISVSFAVIVYIFAKESIKLLAEIIEPLVKPFLEFSQTLRIIYITFTLVLAIALVIASSRFIKYASSSKEIFVRKKYTLLFSLFLSFVGLALFIYSALTTLNSVPIITVNIVFAVVTLISIILIIYSLFKERTLFAVESKQVKTNFSQPAIYTKGLDGDTQTNNIKTKTTQLKQNTNLPNVSKGSLNAEKLIEHIGKLDRLRAEGALSPQEYTKLKQQIIKKFI